MNDSKLGDLDRQRIEAASTLANCIIDVINEHVSLHGTHDPGLWRLLAATLATVAEEIRDKVDQNFMASLAELLLLGHNADNNR